MVPEGLILKEPMTDDELMDLGTRAEYILRDDTFNALYSLITDQIALDILATAPDDSKIRNQLYFTYHGMRSFSDRLTGLVLAKQQIIAQHENKDDVEYPDEDLDETQHESD